MLIYVLSVTFVILNYMLQYAFVEEYLCRLFYLLLYVEIYTSSMCFWTGEDYLPTLLDLGICMLLVSNLNKEVVMRYRKIIGYTHHTTIYVLLHIFSSVLNTYK